MPGIAQQPGRAPTTVHHPLRPVRCRRSGFYPDGRNSSAAATPFIPSGMLLKVSGGAESLG